MNRLKNLSKPLIALIIILVSFAGCTISTLLITNGGGLTAKDPADKPQTDTADVSDPSDPDDDNYYVASGYERGEFRAVWVASVLNLDFPTKPGLSPAALKREIEAIVTTTVNLGLNTIILQVRPTGDAFYKSEIFPWSRWLTGEQGVGLQDDFDPLGYWIEVCHDNNIELHAWLNPYRIIHTSANSSDVETLAPDNPVRLNSDLAVAWTNSDGRAGLFLDPGLPEARELIIGGIVELIENYDVDGIHFDDYFYPGRDFSDNASFEAYGNGMELDDWRRENVNTLIRDIQGAIRSHNRENGKSVRWGISPTAIWKNGSTDPLGIPTTAGQESYHALYADTRRWVMEEWVDYICPQIYWYIGYDIADFDAIYTWWSGLCSDYNVDFYVGHAAYREFEDNQPPNWRGEMIRQLEFMSLSEASQGSAFYRYFSLRSNVGQQIRDYYRQTEYFPVREPIMICDTLSVGFPVSDVNLTGTPSAVSGHNILGTSIPDKPLYLNGEEITTRTAEGFFHVFPALEQGDNVLTFSQEDEDDVTIVITLKAPSGGGGDTAAPAKITEVTAYEYATVTADDAWVYSENNTNSGIGYMLSKGSRDRITARSDNNLVKLSCGVWIRNDAITTHTESSALSYTLTGGQYQIGTDNDVIVWESSIFPAAITSFDGSALRVTFGMQAGNVPFELTDDLPETLFESISGGTYEGVSYIEFTLREDAKFEGSIIEYEDGELRLCLKKRKSLSDGDMPLENMTIMLDAGHGGDANGTIGAQGYDLPEKDLVLIHMENIAERLIKLGADVVLTREEDADVTLQERVDLSREVLPDIFISLHVNSIAETTNAAGVRGFSVWYYHANSAALSETALDVLQYINPATNRPRVINHANFFVCRPWWSPHVLFEASFMSNIDDYVWMLDPMEQARYADAAVDAILDYFAG